MLNQFKRLAKRALGRHRAELSDLTKVDFSTIEKIRSMKITYLTDAKLASLALTCRELEAKQVDGIFIEAGCALGGSAALIASIKKKARPFQIYDVFGMIPPPTVEDPPEVHERFRAIAEGESVGIDGDKYYGYELDLVKIVSKNLSDLTGDLDGQGIEIIQGLVQETMRI